MDPSSFQSHETKFVSTDWNAPAFPHSSVFVRSQWHTLGTQSCAKSSRRPSPSRSSVSSILRCVWPDAVSCWLGRRISSSFDKIRRIDGRKVLGEGTKNGRTTFQEIEPPDRRQTQRRGCRCSLKHQQSTGFSLRPALHHLLPPAFGPWHGWTDAALVRLATR
jgi:hypothetical protein